MALLSVERTVFDISDIGVWIRIVFTSVCMAARARMWVEGSRWDQPQSKRYTHTICKYDM